MEAERVYAPRKDVQKYLAEAELESIAKTVSVPTNDDDVRSKLRRIGEPAELDREDRADRRERLRRLLIKRKAEGIDDDELSDYESENSDAEETWIEGPPGLAKARQQIADFSTQRAAARLIAENVRWDKYNENKSGFTNAELSRRRQDIHELKQLNLVGTQGGFSRAVSSLATNDGRFVVAGDWSGSITVLDMQNNMDVIAQSSAHKLSGAGAAQTCVAWSNNIASGGADGNVALHSFADNQVQTKVTLQAHTARVTCVAFHPSNSFLFSASHDSTWRLWDLESDTCILVQSGHIGALKTVTPHEDGSLLCTGGDDTMGRVWDLRSGDCISILQGHARSIHASSWRQNVIVTGGADNQCLVWDLRRPTHPITSIPAHNSTVTDLHLRGDSLATSSVDGTVRLWSCDNWRLQRTLHTPTRVFALTPINNGWLSARWDRCIDWYANTDRTV